MDLLEPLFELLKAKDMKLATAESCTGGLIGAAMTSRAGSTAVYERGFITYSNEAKAEQLGVPVALIETKGAVSADVGEAMAAGALKNSRADIAVSVTGIAGPDGGSDEKPVGLVYFGYALKDDAPTSVKHNFGGDRNEVRAQSVEAALSHLISILENLS